MIDCHNIIKKNKENKENGLHVLELKYWGIRSHYAVSNDSKKEKTKDISEYLEDWNKSQ